MINMPWQRKSAPQAGAPVAAASTPSPPWQGSPGKRCYAIGDVHGCPMLLGALFARIGEDMAARAPRETFIVLLGDLIDRGPDSRGVIDLVLDPPIRDARLFCIGGNHEDSLARGLSGEQRLLGDWIKHGGRACAASYGVATGDLQDAPPEEIESRLLQAMPQRHVRFLDEMLDQVRFGDYLLVHAGIRPDRAPDRQDPEDCRWIREPFIESDMDFGVCVVHGHTVTPEPERRHNRIGIDTGAYQTGILTALRIEDDETGFLQVEGAPE